MLLAMEHDQYIRATADRNRQNYWFKRHIKHVRTSKCKRQMNVNDLFLTVSSVLLHLQYKSPSLYQKHSPKADEPSDLRKLHKI